MTPIRIAIADDHPAFRAGLRAYLDAEADFEVVGEASDGLDALALVEKHAPDVLMLDLEMPRKSGLEVAEALHAAGSPTAVLVLSAYEDEDYIYTVLRRGASGYLTKHESLPTIVEAVRGVAHGEAGWLSRRVAALSAGVPPSQRALDRFQTLSRRERDVIDQLALGLTNASIGKALFISENTVKKHVHSAFEKLGVRTRAEAVAWMWRHGLVESDAASK